MTSEYDFSVFDVKEHNFAFANLTAEEADEKRKLYEQFVAEKAAMKEVASQSSVVGDQDAASPESDGPTSKPKPAFKPSFKKASPESVVSSQSSAVGGQDAASPESDGPTSKPKPAFKPSFKKVASPESVVSSQSSVVSSQSTASPNSEVPVSSDQSPTSKPKPAFKPSFKPKANPKPDAEESNDNP
jgi:NADH-quinone oxidoreductase subunit I